MDEYTEGVLVVAVYLFVVTAFSLPFLVGYLFIKIKRLINRATAVLKYIEDEEEENRKYHQ